MKNRIFLLLSLLAISTLHAQTTASKPAVESNRLSQQMAATAMTIWKDSFALTPGKPAKWSYDQGVILKGIEGVWNATGNGDYFRYIQKCMDFFVGQDGTIRDYKPDEYNIDHINNGKQLLLLYRVLGTEKYRLAANRLRQQLKQHPRTKEGGFWHKQIYPWQMWLDGLYMGQPFYAEYAMLFHEDTAFNDIANQFMYMERHARDAKTGLLYHGWDESKQQKWADKSTGLSPHFWGRALGWYGMAMVDVLDYFPSNHPGRDSIIAILNRFAKAVVKYQDKNGLWYDIVDLATRKGNYHEASASCMLVYALAKGARNGYLPASYTQYAKKGYQGIVNNFLETDANGQLNLKGIVQVSGLGGNPYRDGSFEYYMSEPVVVNDPKGVGAFIKCSVEMEMIPLLAKGKGKTVLLDGYFNNERKPDATGQKVPWHYTWNDKANSGFAMLGDLYRMNGAGIKKLDQAPSGKNLKGAHVYIIVDPDTKKENDQPHFIESPHVKAIADWVKAGGTLVLMSNDSGNSEFEHFNELTGAFGVKFNEDSKNRVQGNKFEQGAVLIPAGNPVFITSRKAYIKEISTLQVSPPASTILTHNGDNVVAFTKWGKGRVIAVCDPWFYNEYIDGRKLPPEFENYKAAVDLVNWTLK